MHEVHATVLRKRLSSTPLQTPLKYTQLQGKAGLTCLSDMKAAGVYLSNHGLSPVTDSTTVCVQNGETVVTPGPFAETVEHLEGYFQLDCKTLDEAIGWAAKMPYAKGGSVEIRPMITTPRDDMRSHAHQVGRWRLAPLFPV